MLFAPLIESVLSVTHVFAFVGESLSCVACSWEVLVMLCYAWDFSSWLSDVITVKAWKQLNHERYSPGKLLTIQGARGEWAREQFAFGERRGKREKGLTLELDTEWLGRRGGMEITTDIMGSNPRISWVQQGFRARKGERERERERERESFWRRNERTRKMFAIAPKRLTRSGGREEWQNR